MLNAHSDLPACEQVDVEPVDPVRPVTNHDLARKLMRETGFTKAKFDHTPGYTFNTESYVCGQDNTASVILFESGRASVECSFCNCKVMTTVRWIDHDNYETYLGVIRTLKGML